MQNRITQTKGIILLSEKAQEDDRRYFYINTNYKSFMTSDIEKIIKKSLASKRGIIQPNCLEEKYGIDLSNSDWYVDRDDIKDFFLMLTEKPSFRETLQGYDSGSDDWYEKISGTSLYGYLYNLDEVPKSSNDIDFSIIDEITS